MITVYSLKSRFQNLLRPICLWLADSGVSANQITIIALVLSVIYGALLFLNMPILWLLLPVFLVIRMGLNAIDGMLAREHNMKSKLGMALNELGDVFSDCVLFLPFLIYAPHSTPIIIGFIISSILTELCGVLAFMISGERRYDGPMGKSDRAAIIGILGILIGLGIHLNNHIGWIFFILIGLCLVTCFKRLNAAIRT